MPSSQEDIMAARGDTARNGPVFQQVVDVMWACSMPPAWLQRFLHA